MRCYYTLKCTLYKSIRTLFNSCNSLHVNYVYSWRNWESSGSSFMPKVKELEEGTKVPILHSPRRHHSCHPLYKWCPLLHSGTELDFSCSYLPSAWVLKWYPFLQRMELYNRAQACQGHCRLNLSSLSLQSWDPSPAARLPPCRTHPPPPLFPPPTRPPPSPYSHPSPPSLPPPPLLPPQGTKGEAGQDGPVCSLL